MAQVKISKGLVLVILAMLCADAMAQSSCTNVLVNLSPCLDYITGKSSTPTSGCCTQLASVVKSQPQCLCQVLDGGGSSLGIKVNQTQALALPSACNVQTPPTSQCKTANSPAGARTVPSTDDGSSDGNSIKLSIPRLFVVFAATYLCYNFQDILAY
ncbi:putative plant lipid transfer protein/Par allergen [Medicago truncatula]|uniref:Lipid transfer protein n=1 Tax=Medicago truncatula TaxID=3880 RepID=B7FGM2_MEDTR|nr:non-specific lipid transfer protein GPI-anchored 5 [Medicago truncatula]ACJ83901.1 unknown [Medicago truncatula]KEH43855.1 Lipid transfer protein [Medicago truncatula]RHN82002.1 putative plant lipid transfer protein/Par allergen [Medicago truncatula]